MYWCSFISLIGPAIARSNSVVIVPSEKHPLPALALYQVNPPSTFLLVAKEGTGLFFLALTPTHSAHTLSTPHSSVYNVYI